MKNSFKFLTVAAFASVALIGCSSSSDDKKTPPPAGDQTEYSVSDVNVKAVDSLKGDATHKVANVTFTVTQTKDAEGKTSNIKVKEKAILDAFKVDVKCGDDTELAGKFVKDQDNNTIAFPATGADVTADKCFVDVTGKNVTEVTTANKGAVPAEGYNAGKASVNITPTTDLKGDTITLDKTTNATKIDYTVTATEAGSVTVGEDKIAIQNGAAITELTIADKETKLTTGEFVTPETAIFETTPSSDKFSLTAGNAAKAITLEDGAAVQISKVGKIDTPVEYKVVITVGSVIPPSTDPKVVIDEATLNNHLEGTTWVKIPVKINNKGSENITEITCGLDTISTKPTVETDACTGVFSVTSSDDIKFFFVKPNAGMGKQYVIKAKIGANETPEVIEGVNEAIKAKVLPAYNVYSTNNDGTTVSEAPISSLKVLTNAEGTNIKGIKIVSNAPLYKYAQTTDEDREANANLGIEDLKIKQIAFAEKQNLSFAVAQSKAGAVCTTSAMEPALAECFTQIKASGDGQTNLVITPSVTIGLGAAVTLTDFFTSAAAQAITVDAVDSIYTGSTAGLTSGNHRLSKITIAGLKKADVEGYTLTCVSEGTTKDSACDNTLTFSNFLEEKGNVIAYAHLNSGSTLNKKVNLLDATGKGHLFVKDSSAFEFNSASAPAIGQYLTAEIKKTAGEIKAHNSGENDIAKNSTPVVLTTLNASDDRFGFVHLSKTPIYKVTKDTAFTIAPTTRPTLVVAAGSGNTKKMFTIGGDNTEFNTAASAVEKLAVDLTADSPVTNSQASCDTLSTGNEEICLFEIVAGGSYAKAATDTITITAKTTDEEPVTETVVFQADTNPSR